MYPEDLHYYKEHQWVRVGADGIGIVGITFYAQEQLGEVIYVDLPEVGAQMEQFAKLGEIESVKAVSDVFCPVSGQVVAVNEKLKDSPESVNQEPYGEGWMLHLKMSDPSEVEALMTAADYERLIAEAT